MIRLREGAATRRKVHDMAEEARSEARRVAEAAKAASAAMAQASAELRNRALLAMGRSLRESCEAILLENAADMDAARAAGTKESLLDRLMLDARRVESMAAALESLAALPDPVGVVQQSRTLDSGIELQRVSVPLGVVAVVYEARPNVTADAAGICLKAGNACVLRGGSLAARSCSAIARAMSDAAVTAGLPEGCLGIIESGGREAADELMGMRGVVDVLVPRGGAGLINHCVENAKVPVIETGTGNCHVYVHATADLSMAQDILVNAKCRRFGVCNAAETLLVDRSVAASFLPRAAAALAERGVRMHCDEGSLPLAQGAPGALAVPAMEDDWETEYLAPDIAVKLVSGVGEAIGHVNRYGTRHSEAIVADAASPLGAAAIERFLNEVDAAAVYANASTAFTDGGQFGLGAEIGISTQKLHVRGPFALEGLTSYKYVLRGTGQVRP